MKYARIHDGSVAELYAPITGFTIEQCFHPDLVAQMVPCTDDVQVGWAYADGVFTDPNAAQEQTTETTTETPTQ
jgi:hypothetical protein